jgi:hypothetical protein
MAALARAFPPDEQRVGELVARVRPSPEEVVSLWPRERRSELVVVIRVDDRGEPSIQVRLRERDGTDAVLTRRVRGDVPVVLEDGGRAVVVPLSSVAVRK